MKATKLIRDKGLKYAKDIVDTAPSNATEWNEGFEFECGQCVEISKADREKYFVDLSELKRLVESFETIGLFGGISGARAYLKRLEDRCRTGVEATKTQFQILKQAVNDYDSIYPPKCIHGYDVACLICGFGTVDGERVYRNKGKTL